MADYQYDIAVIGGGPGGYVAAIAAAKEGKTVCLIERGELGGVCLNEGCIPTKTLIRSAELLHEMRAAARFGITGVEPEKLGISLPALHRRKAEVVGALTGGIGALLRGNKVTVIKGDASFIDPHTVKAGEAIVSAAYVIIATGSKPVFPASIALEGGNTLLTSREALELDAVPESVAVIGGGVIGIEFAFLLNRLGSRVTVLECMDRILPMLDADVLAQVRRRLKKDGIAIHTAARVHRVRDNSVFFTLQGEERSLRAGAVLMAAGRAPNVSGLALEAAGLALERGALRTDAQLRTAVPHIFAIGDVNGQSMLAHTASHEGHIAVATICGRKAAVDYGKIPSCIYLEPEIACIGLTEEEARAQYGEVKTGSFPMTANGKSLVEGDTEGMIKVIVSAAYGEILGVHMYGRRATDMIAGIAVAMTAEATAEEIMHAVAPHPTFSEAVPEAFMAAFGKAIHRL